MRPELRYGVMVALQILVLSVQVRILVSQRKTANPLKISGFCIKNQEAGTQTGQNTNQEFSLHDVIMAVTSTKKAPDSSGAMMRFE